ncbi:MAG: hypothetical protein OXT09_11160 [Myxococcales bacterium]|nr:hypothetical protein [Myxococcales bacterium]
MGSPLPTAKWLVPWLAVALCVAAASASAQQDDDDICEDPAPLGQKHDLQVRPPDGASRVARDAPIVVRYQEAADLDTLLLLLEDDTSAACDALLCLFRDDREQGGSDRVPIEGTVERVDGRTLVFMPDALLQAEAHHYALIARAGFERLTRGEIEFETGDARDREPPELHIDELGLEVETLPPECEYPPGTVRVGVAAPEAQDDGNEESVEILLYLTRARGLKGPELRARAPNLGAVPMSFMLAPEEARETVCLALRAVDAVGKVAEYDEEICFNPGEGGFFQAACHAGRPGAPAPGPLAALAILIPLAAMRLGRQSRRRAGRAQEGP